MEALPIEFFPEAVHEAAAGELRYCSLIEALDRESDMFVVSRTPGESLLINDAIEIKVAVIGEDFVDVLFLDHYAGTRELLTLKTGRFEPICAGVQCLLILQSGRERVRLGFVAERGVKIVRAEHPDPEGAP